MELLQPRPQRELVRLHNISLVRSNPSAEFCGTAAPAVMKDQRATQNVQYDDNAPENNWVLYQASIKQKECPTVHRIHCTSGNIREPILHPF